MVVVVVGCTQLNLIFITTYMMKNTPGTSPSEVFFFRIEWDSLKLNNGATINTYDFIVIV